MALPVRLIRVATRPIDKTGKAPMVPSILVSSLACDLVMRRLVPTTPCLRS
jgi:hypothetical protein